MLEKPARLQFFKLIQPPTNHSQEVNHGYHLKDNVLRLSEFNIHPKVHFHEPSSQVKFSCFILISSNHYWQKKLFRDTKQTCIC